ncbi:hypothetical protein CL615_01860 [archaeon]|jgi:DNA replication initiation complex subunit (GINS family)|nr:hypothetical protein [archaeon]MDP6547894.1 hypothetical protein [Candidatus Woesearchaeota archaeon]|tara:strand:- start:7501 stop:8130 length:630 start_codon:yes stop_codon:yes gene_type:complete
METKEINITYETLFEILKREKDITELQKLEPGFFSDFVDYLNEKKKVLGKEDSMFSYDEKKKVEKQIDNARRIIKEIYERREKKIVDIAMIKSRTKSDVMDTSSFLENEKRLFDETVKVLDNFRNEVISNVLSGKNPVKTDVADEKSKSEVAEEKKNAKIIRFLNHVPKFVGKELEDYGPFEEEDIANLPSEIADVLISKGSAEEIKSG